MTAFPLDSVVTASQGSSAHVSGSWPVVITDLTNILGTPTVPFTVAGSGVFNVTGTVAIANQVTLTTTGSIPVTGSVRLSEVATVTGSVRLSEVATIQGRVASGSTFQNNPVLVAGIDSGSNVRIPFLDADGTQVVRERQEPTFVALITGSAIGNNKSMMSILNAGGSGAVIKIREIWITNVKTTAVTGIVGIFEFRRITGHSGGTQQTGIETMDTQDTLNSSVTVRTNATISGESTTMLARKMWSTDDWGAGTLDTESHNVAFQNTFPVWVNHDKNQKPITLRPGEGLTVKHAVNSTAGSFDLMIGFTQA